MAQRKNRCKKPVTLAGRRTILCGMPLNLDGTCPEHGKQTS